MKNSFGTALTVTLFGESHGPAVGAVLDGLAPGMVVDGTLLATEMAKRRASGETATPRREPDAVEFLSGVYQGRTTGTPLCLLVRNTDVDSTGYEHTGQLPRPGHADYTGYKKYFGYADGRGGGHFSGRLTAPLVAAGALCRQILAARGVVLGSHLARCGGVADAPLPQDETALRATLDALNQKTFATIDDAAGAAMQQAILAAKADGDSVGGLLETAVCGLPAGLGEPFFGSVESVLSALLFSIPGVKGVSFGLGFGFANQRGSQAADDFVLENGAVRTATNHNGGLNGGVTNGMPLVVQAVIKPTPSIGQARMAQNLATGQMEPLPAPPRHDASILPRARAVADAVCAIGLVDLFSQRYGILWQNGDLPAEATP